MSITLLKHFDTVFSVNNDPFNATFKLPNLLYNVKKITLKSLEMPINFNNIRATGTLNIFTINFNGYIYNAVIPPGNYTTIASLLTALNTAIGLLLPVNNTLVFTVNSTNNIVINITSTLYPTSSINLIPTQFSNYILGFKFNSVFQGYWFCPNTVGNTITGTITSVSTYNLNIDNYILLNIANVSSLNSNVSSVYSHFKLQLNATNGTIYYLNNGNIINDQYIETGSSNITLSSLNVVILDRFGNNILCNNNDYSFTLLIECNEL